MTGMGVFGAKGLIETSQGPATIYSLKQLEREGIGIISHLPYTIRILLESVLRNYDGRIITEDDIVKLAQWQKQDTQSQEIPFKPTRVLLQDFTGVPAVVDLAALRSAMLRLGGDPKRINPIIPVDLVIDHSVQVDRFGSKSALFYNAEREFERNRERYEFLRWGQSAFANFRVVPPATGIVHQVNLEYLAQVVDTRVINGEFMAFPDTLVGTDSHTTMINGLGVLGWGVGGIEAEATMLGQPIYLLTPQVVGFKLTGELLQGATATDLVLTVTQMLRKHGVVGKFVEYFGSGVNKLSLADRATLANMAPEYGATMGYFPVDDVTLTYLENTGRSPERIDLLKRYTMEQNLFRQHGSSEPIYSETIELDMNTVEPCLAGPIRPQDRISLQDVKNSFQDSLTKTFRKSIPSNDHHELTDGAVVIAAITSCTNTSNPSVMVAAGLMAKNAVEKGLRVPGYVKTSLAPGSQVVTRYLDDLGLTPYLEELGFFTVGYGCTSCIGNSGPLPDEITNKIRGMDLVAASVLSGNRNFEGRVHPLTKINYLASPPLVVAYALAGSMNLDLTSEPLGQDTNGDPVYLADIWPGQNDIQTALETAVTADLFTSAYKNVFKGNEAWNRIDIPAGDNCQWAPDSTYIKEPAFFEDIGPQIPKLEPIMNARVLVLLGDSVTTDHISPAGSIPTGSPAEKYLFENGVERRDFNSFGSRRGNHEVMVRGTFGNIRLRNLLTPGSEGGVTTYLPTNSTMSIYNAAMKYKEKNTPLIVIAGKEYGTGSSRDWAAKGTALLGIKAIIAESYERIHRSNLVGMGVLPLQFCPGENAEKLGITGIEIFDIDGIDDELKTGGKLRVRARDMEGNLKEFKVITRVDSPIEVEYYKNGGVLHTVLRDMLAN
jgi:aconitate hydratase